MSLFVDTSIWYAAAVTTDSDNDRAKTILKSGEFLVMTDHILVETMMLLNRRLGRAAAERFWKAARESSVVIETVGPADLESAWQIGQQWPDQDFSIVDRTSFAVMRRLGIERAASLDNHFAVYRFGPQRRHAFTVLP